jgi:prepilin-type N-terminal cleavage/methylation domain-containing protein
MLTCFTPKKRGAFTLIEILCVIAIIGSIATIAYPAFPQARAAAYKVSCIGNLAQLGIATATYQADYDDHYPYGINAFERFAPHYYCGRTNTQNPASFPYTVDDLRPYGVSPILRCPADVGKSFPNDHVDLAPFFPYNDGSSYIFADLLLGQTSSYFLDPASSVWACDVAYDWHIKPPKFTFGVVNALAYDGHASTRHDGERAWPVWMPSWQIGS